MVQEAALAKEQNRNKHQACSVDHKNPSLDDQENTYLRIQTEKASWHHNHGTVGCHTESCVLNLLTIEKLMVHMTGTYLGDSDRTTQTGTGSQQKVRQKVQRPRERGLHCGQCWNHCLCCWHSIWASDLIPASPPHIQFPANALESTGKWPKHLNPCQSDGRPRGSSWSPIDSALFIVAIWGMNWWREKSISFSLKWIHKILKNNNNK